MTKYIPKILGFLTLGLTAMQFGLVDKAHSTEDKSYDQETAPLETDVHSGCCMCGSCTKSEMK